MPQTNTGINYEVVASGSPNNPTGRRETWRRGVNQATEILQCNWVDWNNFVLSMIGTAKWNAVSNNSANGYTLSRTLPTPHPQYGWLIPIQVELLGVIGTPYANGDIGVFMAGDPDKPPVLPPLTPLTGFGSPKAIAAVTYEAVRYNAFRDDAFIAGNPAGERLRWVEWDRESEVQALAVEGSRWAWADNRQSEFNDQSNHGGVLRRYHFGNITYQWHEVPSILDANGDPILPPTLIANWQAVAGHVNSVTFDGHPPGTLMCGAAQYKKTIAASGYWTWEVQIPVSDQPDQWNQKFRYCDKNGNFNPDFYRVIAKQQIKIDVPPQTVTVFADPYPQADFNQYLFSALPLGKPAQTAP